METEKQSRYVFRWGPRPSRLAQEHAAPDTNGYRNKRNCNKNANETEDWGC